MPSRREREEALLKRFSTTREIYDAFIKRMDADAIAGCLRAAHLREDAIRAYLANEMTIRNVYRREMLAILDGQA